VQEHKKILFYYPTDVELDTKIRQIGLCEAVIKFTWCVMCIKMFQLYGNCCLHFVVSYCSLSILARLRNDLYCVEWDVKPSIPHHCPY